MGVALGRVKRFCLVAGLLPWVLQGTHAGGRREGLLRDTGERPYDDRGTPKGDNESDAETGQSILSRLDYA